MGKILHFYSLNIPKQEVINDNHFLQAYSQDDSTSFTLPLFLMGDEIFALKDYLMIPSPGTRHGTLSADQAVFNTG